MILYKKLIHYFLVLSLASSISVSLVAKEDDFDPMTLAKIAAGAAAKAAIGAVVGTAFYEGYQFVRYYVTTTPEERELEQKRKDLQPELLRIDIERKEIAIEQHLLWLKKEREKLEKFKNHDSEHIKEIKPLVLTLRDAQKTHENMKS